MKNQYNCKLIFQQWNTLTMSLTKSKLFISMHIWRGIGYITIYVMWQHDEHKYTFKYILDDHIISYKYHSASMDVAVGIIVDV